MKIRVMGIDVEIVYEKDLGRQHEHTGIYDPVKSIIKIDADLNKQEQGRILIHEILEVINRSLDLGLNHDAQINKLDASLYQVIADNFDVLRKLCGL